MPIIGSSREGTGMYSLVLMTAMTASAPETPKFFCLFQGICNRFGSGCGGCAGCQGYANGCRGACNGCGGCFGCNGCYGCAGCNGGAGGVGYGNWGRTSAGSVPFLSGQS